MLTVKSNSISANYSLDLKYNILIFFKVFTLLGLRKKYGKILIVSGQLHIYLFFLFFKKNVYYRESNSPIFRMRESFFIKRYFHLFLFKIMQLFSENLNIIVPSRFVKNDFYNFKNTHTIPNFIKCIKTTKTNIYNTFIFGHVGRPTHAKGFDRYTTLSNSMKMFKFYHFGPHSNLKESNVKSFGVYDNLNEIYPKFNTLLLLSRTEGFPNVVNEAVQFGTSLILSYEMSWLLDFDYLKPYIIFIGNNIQIQKFILSSKPVRKSPLSPRTIQRINNYYNYKYGRLLNE